MSFKKPIFIEQDDLGIFSISKALFLSLSCLGSLMIVCSENFLVSDAAELSPRDSTSTAYSGSTLQDTESFRRGLGPRQYPMQPGPPCVEDGVTVCPRRELLSTYRQSTDDGKSIDSTSATGPTAGTSSSDSSMTNQAPSPPSDDQIPQPNVRRRGRIRELEEIKAQLAEKELELLSKENALLEQEQDIRTLQAELEIEKKLRVLITKEKEKAEEEAALAMGLCSGSTMLP
eukprot:jgi/Picsp_1/3983/NSC_01495-R1_expressed protein [Chlorella variabilis]